MVHFLSAYHLYLVAAEIEADQADLPARPPHKALHLIAPRRQLGERGGGGEAECGQGGAGGQREARPRPAGQVRQRGQAGAIQIGLQPDIQYNFRILQPCHPSAVSECIAQTNKTNPANCGDIC